jgi:hypothetical protein
MSIHFITDDCAKCVRVGIQWRGPCPCKSNGQRRRPQQNTKAEKKPLAGSGVSTVILRDKVTIREVIGGNGIPQIYTVKKIAGDRDVHVWLPVAAENNVWPGAFSGINIFPDHNESVRLNLASSNALEPAFKLQLRITGANERHHTKNNKPQSESGRDERLNECIKTHDGVAAQR